MQKALRNRFNILLAEKAHREGRAKITRDEVAAATGLALNTVNRIANNLVTMYADHVVVALCAYFECELGDLLVLEEVPDESEEEHRIPV